MIDFIRQTLKGRSIYRTLFNQYVAKFSKDLSGEVLDLAGGGNASYYSYLPKNLKVIRTNIIPGEKIDQVLDVNKPLPFRDKSIQSIFFFNAIYILEDRLAFLRECRRILRSEGVLFICSPFIGNEMPEPHDYCRLTAEGLEKVFREAGFKDFEIIRFGGRFSSAVYLLDRFFFFRVIRLCANAFALLLDLYVPKSMQKGHPAPLGYFCILRKGR